MPAGERNLMVFFMFLSVGAVVFAFDLVLPEARLFPLMTAIVTSSLILLYFVVINVPGLRRRLAIYVEDDVFLKLSGVTEALEEQEAEEAGQLVEVAHRIPDEVRHRREIAIIGLMVGLGALSLVVGLAIATPIFMLAVMVGYSRRPWPLAITVTAATSALMYIVFSVVLRLPPHFGMLERLL